MTLGGLAVKLLDTFSPFDRVDAKPMQLTDMQFVDVHARHVTVRVRSSEEAKQALRELRHLKKELRQDLRDLKAAHKTAAAREKRASRAKPQPLYENFGDFVRLSVASLGTLFREQAKRNAPRSALDLAGEIGRCDALIDSIEACALQIEGKLISDAGAVR